MQASDITRNLDVDSKTILNVFDGKYNQKEVMAMVGRLANDTSNYDNMRAAGRMLLYDATRPCGDLRSYADFMIHRLHPEIHAFMVLHAKQLQAAIDAHSSDMYESHDLFSAATLVKTYLMRPTYGQDPMETPLQLYMRCAVQFYHHHGVDRVIQCFQEMAAGYYTPASPTLFNAGTQKPQCSSCFLISIGDDLESILYSGVGDSGMISRLNGGLGINMNNLRHSMIADVGMSSGVMPAARIYDRTVKYVDQGGKRDGACTLFLRPWHIDVKDFIESTDNFKDHSVRLSTVNTCLWMSRLFFKRCRTKGKWTTFCPAKAKVLNGLYGYEFEAAYIAMEQEAERSGRVLTAAREAVVRARNELMERPNEEKLRVALSEVMKVETKARKAYIEHKTYEAAEIMRTICETQIKSAMPYIMHADTINWKSNQKNLGPVDSSNLCVSGDTPILTDQGYLPIGKLVNTEVKVWNGDQWSAITPKQTGSNQRLVRVTLDNGTHVDCTPYHKFILAGTTYDQRLDAKDLKTGTELKSFKLPSIRTSSNQDLEHIMLHHVADFGVSMANGEVMLRFKENAGTWNELLLELQTSGIAAYLNGRDLVIPSECWTWDCHAFWPLNAKFNVPSQQMMVTARVVSVMELEGIHNTYCFTEPLNHAGVFGGILTGNCLEITERSTPEAIASCNLSSINVARYTTNKPVTVPIVDRKEFLPQLLGAFDFAQYGKMVQSVVENLEEVIDANYYPLDQHTNDKVIRGKISSLNFRTRPLGIGVSGFMDAVYQMDLAPEDPRTEQFNKILFACQYFNGLISSLRLAIKRGTYVEFKTGSYKRLVAVDRGDYPDRVQNGDRCHYEEAKGSPLSNGQFQFDLWSEEAAILKAHGDLDASVYDEKDDVPIDPVTWGQQRVEIPIPGTTEVCIVEPTWDSLRTAIVKYGVRHSLLFANMPTASTANVFRNCESVEAHQANVYQRNVISGNYLILNRHLHRDLHALGAWSYGLVEFIGKDGGSVRYMIDYIIDHPEEFPTLFEKQSPGTAMTTKPVMKAQVYERLTYLTQKYRTMFEIKQKTLIRYTAQRSRYICQSSSMNIYCATPDVMTLQAIHAYTDKIGIKTGMYYLRMKPPTLTGSFNVSADLLKYHNDLLVRKSNTAKVPAAPALPPAPVGAPPMPTVLPPPVIRKAPLVRFTSEPVCRGEAGCENCSS